MFLIYKLQLKNFQRDLIFYVENFFKSFNISMHVHSFDVQD